MSNPVLDYVRQKDANFKDVPDEDLTLYLAQKKPEFLKDPEFKSDFENVVVGKAISMANEGTGALLNVLTNPAAGEAAKSGRDQTAKEELKQQTEQARAEAKRNRIATGLVEAGQRVTGFVSEMNPLNVLKRTLEIPGQLTGSPYKIVPAISEETARKAVDFLDPISYDEPGSAREGVKQAISGLVSGLTSPDQVAGLLLGVKEPEAVARLFQVEMASQVSPGAQRLVEAVKTGDKTQISKALSEVAFNVAAPASIEAHMRRPLPRTMLESAAEQAKDVAPMTAAVIEQQAKGEPRFLQEGTEELSTRPFLPQSPQEAPEAKPAPSTPSEPSKPQEPEKAAQAKPESETVPVEDLQAQMDEELGQGPDERVTAASYTNPKTGETSTGNNHIEAAKAQGVNAPKVPTDRHGDEFGFEVQDQNTGKIRYVSRDEAEDIARENGQLLREPQRGALHSDEVEFEPKKGKKDAVHTESPQVLRPVRDESKQSEQEVPAESTSKKDDEGGGQVPQKTPELTKEERRAKLKAENAAYRAKKEQRTKSNLEAAGEEGSVELKDPSDPNKRLLVTPDISEPGKWRVTSVDELGPSGHNVFNSREAAIRAASGESHTDMVKGPPYYSGDYQVTRAAKPEKVSKPDLTTGQHEQIAEAAKKPKQAKAERLPDIIDELKDRFPKGINITSKGDFANLVRSAKGRAKKLLFIDKPGAEPLDKVMKALEMEGRTVGSQDEFLQMILDAGAGLKGQREAAKAEAKQLSSEEALTQKFTDVAVNNDRKEASERDSAKPVPVDDLKVGSKFKIEGEQFEVTSIDPEGDVIVSSEKFGEQRLNDGSTFHPDNGEVIHPEESGDFGFGTGEETPAESAKPAEPKVKAKERALTKAEQDEFQDLSIKARRAREEGGEPLTTEETKRYDELTSMAGQFELLGEDSPSGIKSRISQLKDKLSQLERLRVRTQERAFESKHRRNELFKEAVTYDNEAKKLREEISKLEEQLPAEEPPKPTDQPKPSEPYRGAGDINPPKFSTGTKVTAGEGFTAREGEIAGTGPKRPGEEQTYFVKTNLGEVLYPESALKERGAEPDPVTPQTSPTAIVQPEQRYRIKNSGPQTYKLLERLPASEVEIANGEQPVRVKNEKTGAEETILEGQLQPVKDRTAEEKAASKPMSKKELDDELRRVGLDPSSFKTSIQKRMALKRAKAKGGSEAGFTLNLPQAVIDFGKDLLDKAKDFATWSAGMVKKFGTMTADAIQKLWNHLTGNSPASATPSPMAPTSTPSVFQKPKIAELGDALKGLEGEKMTLEDKIRDAFNIGEKYAAGKDAVARTIAGLKATGDYLIQKWSGYNTLDDLLRAKGNLSKELEIRGYTVRRFAHEVMKAFPKKEQRAAIAKWVDAGGDQNELHWGSMQTQPEYRQAYVDAMSLSGDALEAAQRIRDYFDERLQEAIDAGVLEEGVDNFIHRIYEKDPKAAQAMSAYAQSGILSQNPSLAKKRVFQLDWEAERLGYRPVQDFLARITHYETSLSKAIAARKFVQRVIGFTDQNGNKIKGMLADDGRPIVDVAGLGVPIEDQAGVREATLINPSFKPGDTKNPLNNRADYKERPEFSALRKWKWATTDTDGNPIYVQGNVVIHPKYAARFDKLLKPSALRTTENPVGRGLYRAASGLSSTVKQTMLDLSLFHQVQIAVHGTEHRVNPFNLQKEIDFTNPDVDGLLSGGVTLGGEYRESHSAEGLVGRSITRLIPGVSEVMSTYHDYLFQDFIPRMKMQMALHALERNKARYASDVASGKMKMDEIYKMTADQANAAFGELNYITLERSKTAQDIARLVLLAPDFLEARARFAGQALKRGGGDVKSADYWKKGGPLTSNEQRTALLLGALTMYTVARVANVAINGQPHMEPENAFSIIYKNKAYSLRTVQGDILHAIEQPVQFWMSRLNPVFGRTMLEMATGRDYFGRKRSALEQLWDAVSTAYPVSLRTSRERTLMESMMNGMGVTARRFSDVDTAFKLAQKWKEEHGVKMKGEFIYDADKDDLRPLKLALSNNDDSGAVREIKRLIDTKKYTMSKLNDYWNRYSDMPFTGSRDNDRKFAQTLTDDQKKTFDAAKEHKHSLRKLYQQARDKYTSALHSKSEADVSVPDEAQAPVSEQSEMDKEMQAIP